MGSAERALIRPIVPARYFDDGSPLGLRLQGDRVRVAPCLPADWNAFTVQYRYRETVSHIKVHQTAHATGDHRLSIDGDDQVGRAFRHDSPAPQICTTELNGASNQNTFLEPAPPNTRYCCVGRRPGVRPGYCGGKNRVPNSH